MKHKTNNLSEPKKTPAVAVDTLIFSVIDNKLKILLIKILGGAYKNKWAIPGGLVDTNESLEKAASRILSQKAGVDGIYLEQLATFGDPKRDLRGHSVSVAYFALVNDKLFYPKTTEYYADIAWKNVDALPPMAFDHKKIIEYGKERLMNKLAYSNIAYALLPKEFTLTELQSVYEAVLGKVLDKRNFRKKVQEIKLVKETTRTRQAGANRPAKLFVFTQRQPRVMDIL
ncbi:MAG: NUDIX domain-containing protein [Candidatus Moraniibacteriota bacterium]